MSAGYCIVLAQICGTFLLFRSQKTFIKQRPRAIYADRQQSLTISPILVPFSDNKQIATRTPRHTTYALHRKDQLTRTPTASQMMGPPSKWRQLSNELEAMQMKYNKGVKYNVQTHMPTLRPRTSPKSNRLDGH
ncbi:unnamed protein product [Ceratitis capitata]|uniref:(Mediterranean fruit fly) hypothetical protein n=1 Tax=Ceratitis capitata TaxID=7213 RepID=A0A811UK74_CERCA|nr:unnamed protein product [Ceratitis capitata]